MNYRILHIVFVFCFISSCQCVYDEGENVSTRGDEAYVMFINALPVDETLKVEVGDKIVLEELAYGFDNNKYLEIEEGTYQSIALLRKTNNQLIYRSVIPLEVGNKYTCITYQYNNNLEIYFKNDRDISSYSPNNAYFRAIHLADAPTMLIQFGNMLNKLVTSYTEDNQNFDIPYSPVPTGHIDMLIDDINKFNEPYKKFSGYNFKKGHLYTLVIKGSGDPENPDKLVFNMIETEY